MRITINSVDISARQGDITAWQGDMIVNASNSGLFGGGGVDGAIHRAGGPQIAEECAAIRRKQGGILPGEAAVTGAGRLPLRGIIHTVGPIWKGGGAGENATLAKCYISSLDAACALGAQSIAFPNISTGVYNFPKALASQTAVHTVIDYVSERDSGGLPLKRIEFICYEKENADLYGETLSGYVNME
ncbi:macro domain-containing protein [Paenibacillus sp. S150]|uniref:macro domain-containing protein n=1 Tax=Paenibacillus sp. S150 TaxID=2749826 RepID=UPI001C599A48|nr:macro domain-containing protein [Paenibacillus sp. S150]MBW4083393.1 macro domain-containing protein [Paenibacillus sp. S150]